MDASSSEQAKADSIASRVIRARTQRGLTQVQFAAAVGVSTYSMTAVETGGRPSTETVEKIAAFLGRPVLELDPDGWAFDREAPRRVNAVGQSAQHAAIAATTRKESRKP